MHRRLPGPWGLLWQSIQRTDHVQAFPAGISGRGVDIGVAHRFLHATNVLPAIQQVGQAYAQRHVSLAHLRGFV